MCACAVRAGAGGYMQRSAQASSGESGQMVCGGGGGGGGGGGSRTEGVGAVWEP